MGLPAWVTSPSQEARKKDGGADMREAVEQERQRETSAKHSYNPAWSKRGYSNLRGGAYVLKNLPRFNGWGGCDPTLRGSPMTHSTLKLEVGGCGSRLFLRLSLSLKEFPLTFCSNVTSPLTRRVEAGGGASSP